VADVRVAASLDRRGRYPRLELAAANLANCLGSLGSQYCSAGDLLSQGSAP